jgi:signal peptidase
MTTDDQSSESLVRRIPWRRIANVTGLLVLLAIVLPFVIYAVPQVVGANHSYAVLSGSMEPTMNPGDVIIVNSVAASKIETGDVITFRKGGEKRPTTHRVIEVVEQDGTGAFRTKGDANEDPDQSLVGPDEIQGKVMSIGGHLFVIPYMGYVLQFANTQLGFVALFVVPIALLILTETWSLISSAGATGTDACSEADPEDTADDETEDEDSWEWGEEDDETEGTTAAEPESADDPAEATDSGIAFTAPDLQLGLVVFATFFAYSLWVVYVTLERWAFGVAGGVGAAFLLIAILYLAGRRSGTDAAAEATDSGIAFTAPELQMGIVVVVAFLAYSLWVAYVTVEAWSVAVVVGVAVAVLLLVRLYRSGGGSGTTTDEVSGSGGDGESTTPATASDGGAIEPADGQEDPDSDPDFITANLEQFEGTVTQWEDESNSNGSNTSMSEHPVDDPDTDVEDDATGGETDV